MTDLEREQTLSELSELLMRLYEPLQPDPQPEVTELPVMLTLQEASEKSGISYYGLRRACLDGRLPYFRSGRRYYVSEKNLAECLTGTAEK